MGKWGTIQIIIAEFRDGADLADLDRVLGQEALDKAQRENLHPIGTPRVDWHQLTEADIAMNMGIQREAGITEPVPIARPGDWQALVSLTVIEDAPEPAARR